MKKNNVGLLFNTQKPEAISLASKLCAWGRESGINFMLPPHEASALSIPDIPDNIWREDVEFAVILGGDDLTAIVRADLALDFTAAFLRAFAQSTGPLIAELRAAGVAGLPDRLSACAGVVSAWPGSSGSAGFAAWSRPRARSPGRLVIG